MKPKIISIFLLVCLATALPARENQFAAINDVTWNSPGTNENNSMPLGNGDLALNVWTEQDGDIVLLVAKSDAWSENGQLLKLGRVRVKLTPNPFVSPAAVTQTLKLESGEVQLQAGKNVAHIWVDANHPVIHLEVRAEQPVQMEAKAELWRTKEYHLNQQAVSRSGFFEWGNNPNGLTFDTDTILPAQNNQVTWCHFNTNSIYPLVFEREHLESLLPKYPDPLLHRCFGVAMQGAGLVSKDDQTLASTGAAKTLRLDLYALTQQAGSPAEWQTALSQVVAATSSIKIGAARKAHQDWWTAFWNRSWIQVGGTPEAGEVSQSYALQRFMTACAGRGAQPIKFNGSLFSVGHDLPEGVRSAENNHDPDYRAWGNSYWNQNTRLVYWPLIATGDFDLLKPWFDMYLNALPLAKDRTQMYFHHDGASLPETMFYWGLPNVNDFGWDNSSGDLASNWQRYHIQGTLEVICMMLDEYDVTQDAGFVRSNLVPFADAIVTYYDKHWPRDPGGKIRMSPTQSLETYQLDAVNPTPDIAGLMSVLPRLLGLPADLTSPEQRDRWSKELNDLPPIATGKTAHGRLADYGKGDPDGTAIILPAEKYGRPSNTENPELYVAFPYRLYGVGKAGLPLAQDTFAARRYPQNTCWGQDGTQAAVLGLTDVAKKAAVAEFTDYGGQSFRWFWKAGHDWIPDMDNGGSGMITLQYMMMQCDGKRIQLLPAWPADWTADFKLHAPYQTTVEGHVEHGKVTGLKVVPAARARDVVVVGSPKS